MRILIVDDVAANRRLLRALLEHRSFEVIEKGNGVEALDFLSSNTCDLIISDVQMPRLDGYQLCYTLKNDPRISRIPIIIYTNTYKSPGDQKLAIEFGADKFITRPCPSEVLFNAVDELLQRPASKVPPPQPPPELEAMRLYAEQVVTKLEQKNLQLSEIKEKLLEQIEQSRAAQNRLKHVMFMSPAIIYVLQMHKQSFAPVWISDNIRRVLGYSPDEALQPEWWTQAIHPEDQSESDFRKILNQTHNTREYRIRHKSGHYRWILDEQRIIHSNETGKTEVVGSWLDITERKMAEEAVRRSEERYAQLIEESEQAIFVTNAEGKFLNFNPATCKLFGYTRHEMFALDIKRDIYYDAEERDHFLAELTEHGHARDYEIAVKTKKGEKRILLLNSSVHKDASGMITAFRGIALDITERRLNEERMAMQLAVSRVLAEPVSAEEAMDRIVRGICESLQWDCGSFWQVDSNTGKLRCASNWHNQNSPCHTFSNQICGLTYSFGEGLPGQVWSTGRPIHVEGESIWKGTPVEPVLRESNFKAAFYIPIKNEREVMGVLEFFSSRLLGLDAGLLQMAASLGMQIGQFLERKRIEHAKSELEERLFQSQKIEAIGRLAGGVAHDFNNVLMAVMSYASLIHMNVTEDTVKNFSLEIQKAAERGANLTRQLLAFSRKQVLTPKKLDLNHTIAKMQDMLQRLIGEHIQLVARCGDDPGLVMADPGQIEQVIMNLTVNARDAMPGGGKIMIETGKVHSNQLSHLPEMDNTRRSYVMISVTDTGTGMDKGIHTRIFEPFFTTKEEEKGTGLGLATVYGIVKQSDGHIEVDSSPGMGSTFKIYLPCIEP
jgi:PAS domain S-box-containing protein